jgi:hypothetical protein
VIALALKIVIFFDLANENNYGKAWLGIEHPQGSCQMKQVSPKFLASNQTFLSFFLQG